MVRVRVTTLKHSQSKLNSCLLAAVKNAKLPAPYLTPLTSSSITLDLRFSPHVSSEWSLESCTKRCSKFPREKPNLNIWQPLTMAAMRSLLLSAGMDIEIEGLRAGCDSG
jgi:hypothetical protein